MLPFFAAGGAISGANIGLFYTILMQVGYNYYSKKVLVDLEAGVPLKDALMKVQVQLQPFSDAMMQIALDAMPATIDKSVDAALTIIDAQKQKIVTNLAGEQVHGDQIATTLLGAVDPTQHITALLKLLLPTAEGRRGSGVPGAGTVSPIPPYVSPVQGSKSDAQKILDLRLNRKSLGELEQMVYAIQRGAHFGITDVNLLSNAVISMRNIKRKTAGTQPIVPVSGTPPPTGILAPTKVSKQTLRIERTRLLNAVKSEARVLRLTRNKHKGSPRDAVKRGAYIKQQGVFRKIQQELVNFLDRWKGKF